MLAPRLLRVRLRCAGGNDYVVKERHVGRKAFSLTAPRRRLRPAGRPRYPAPRFRARAPAERHLAPGNVTCPNGGSASQLARDIALSYGRVASIIGKVSATMHSRRSGKDGTSSRNSYGGHRITQPCLRTLLGSTANWIPKKRQNKPICRNEDFRKFRKL
jgi:hypothetical protein